MENKNAWEKYPEGEKRQKVMDFAEDYRKFISKCKTERECMQEFVSRREIKFMPAKWERLQLSLS